MNEEQDLKLTDLDYLTGNHHLQMMKAALPYMEVPEQRMLSVFVKINELQRTISLFRDEEVATMGICSLDHQDKRSPLDMLKAIKPYASSAEQDMIELVSSLLQGGRTSMANMFQNFTGFSGGDLFSMAPLFGQHGQTQPGMTNPDMQAANIPESEIPDTEIPPSEIPTSEIPNSGAAAENSSNTRPMLDQLKGFLSPEQQSRLEMVQMMMQAMQQFT